MAKHSQNCQNWNISKTLYSGHCQRRSKDPQYDKTAESANTERNGIEMWDSVSLEAMNSIIYKYLKPKLRKSVAFIV